MSNSMMETTGNYKIEIEVNGNAETLQGVSTLRKAKQLVSNLELENTQWFSVVIISKKFCDYNF